MKKLALVLFLLSFQFCNNTYAQNDSIKREAPKHFKNSISLNVGFFPLLNLSGHYEYKFWSNRRQTFNATTRINAGFLYLPIPYINPTIGFFAGEGLTNIEITTGVLVLNLQDIALFPSGSLGLRFQKREKPFIFRFGFGVPEMLYLSMGIAFGSK